MDRIETNPKDSNVDGTEEAVICITPSGLYVYRTRKRMYKCDPEGVVYGVNSLFYKHQIPSGLKNEFEWIEQNPSGSNVDGTEEAVICITPSGLYVYRTRKRMYKCDPKGVVYGVNSLFYKHQIPLGLKKRVKNQ
ncbi:MAG: hypothetical protein H3C35_06025 [Bacteroidetes bacterium]|nr:hypothetical protein [Bacteroidota bacterium]